MTRIHKKFKSFSIIIVLAVLLNLSSSLLCKTPQETGLKFFENYSPQDYNDHPQNWGIIQDKNGMIYIANNGCILEFDGIKWRYIEIPHHVVRSLAIDGQGTIFVGGENELGLLETDEKGKLKFKSLMDHLPEENKKFGKVYRTHATPYGIFFYTSQHLLRWYLGEFHVWQTTNEQKFDGAFYENGEYYVRKKNEGVLRIVGDELLPVPWNETFSSVKIYVIDALDDRKLLIGTRERGLFIVENQKVRRFQSKANDFLKEKMLSYGIRLTSGDIALATLYGGVVILNDQGRLKRMFDTDFGLPINKARYLYQDREGNLWIALNIGITKIEYSSPVSFYDNRLGLIDLVLSAQWHGKVFYAGTQSGLFELSPKGKFKPVKGMPNKPTWSILSADNSLLVATTYGVHQLQLNSKKLIIDGISKVLVRSKRDKNRIWVGRPKGLYSLYKKKGSNEWQLEYTFKNIKGEIKSIVEEENGNLWLGSTSNNLMNVLFPAERISSAPKVNIYGESDGLPDMAVRVFTVGNRVVFATNQGLYKFDKEKPFFMPDEILGKRFAGKKDGEYFFRMVEDNTGCVWLHSTQRNMFAVPNKNKGYTINETPFLRLPLGQANSIYPDPDGNFVWFASNEGLIRYDKRNNSDFSISYTTRIRNLKANGSLRYGGHEKEKSLATVQIRKTPEIEFDDRDILIRYAALFYGGQKATKYRYRLDGYDKDWSPWTEKTEQKFTNLSVGTYTFRVEAHNIYKVKSSEANYNFEILPPWYLTLWAKSLYIVAAFFLLFLAFKWRSRKLIREKERLESIIAERTQEIKDKNQQLETQSEKLKEMDIIKSRFFANISHEFRTPLTLLMGPLEQMIDDCPPSETAKKHKLVLMLRNAQRLLRLINQLLELSKLDSGKMKLQAVKTPVTSFIRGIADSFRFLAEQKELGLQFHSTFGEHATDDLHAYIDQRKMEDVMSNLLVNALKFTPPGGRITVTVSPIDDSIQISIHDTGPGIPADQLKHIFDRFYQAEHHHETPEKGSGIGLSLCRELIQLHHGTIEVASPKGEGTTFTIRLPMGKEHLSSSDLAMPGMISNGAGTHMDEFLEQAQEETEETAAPLPPPNGQEPGKEIILVVEDSADMREYIKVALEPHYTVVEAEDGQEGLEKARNLIPDLVVSDIMMPNMDGYELCKALKSDRQTSHIPVILLTAKASEEHIVEGLETGADDYVTKPFSMTILSARIKNLIDIRRQLQQNVNRELSLQPVKTTVSGIDREFLDELQGVLKEHMSDPEFNVEQLCKKLYMGNTTLYRKINALCGQTPTEFIRSYRLKRAAELLSSGFGSVTEVAFEVGFSSRAYFTKCFKEKFQTLPSSYATNASGSQGLF